MVTWSPPPALQIFKSTALPGAPAANAIYLISPVANPNYVEMYVTNVDGTQIKRILNEADVRAMINAIPPATVRMQIVATYAALPPSPVAGDLVLVKDATGDPTVTVGAASYVYDAAVPGWIKLTEFESMDVVLQWGNMQGRPAATPAAIDAAVTASHSHANWATLDALTLDAQGNFLVNSQLPLSRWAALVAW